MPTKHLNSYSGKLNPSQIAAGINLAHHNSTRLFEDAQILYNNNRYPSAFALAVLSIEESGKVSILRQLSVSQSNEEIRAIWRDYRSHTKKNVYWLLLDMAKRGAQKLDDLKPMFDPSSEHPYILDNLKQLSFYSDCLGQAHWSDPCNVISKELVEPLLFVAEALSGKQDVTTKEMELWIKHMKNTHDSLDIGKKALLDWYYDMYNQGLLPSDFDFKQIQHWLGFEPDDSINGLAK